MFLISTVLFICQTLLICCIVKNNRNGKGKQSLNRIKSKILSKLAFLPIYASEHALSEEVEKPDEASVKMIFINLSDLASQLRNFNVSSTNKTLLNSFSKLEAGMALRSQFLNRFFSGIAKDGFLSSSGDDPERIAENTKADDGDSEERGVVPKSKNGPRSPFFNREVILKNVEKVLKRKIKRIVIVIVRKRGVRSLPIIYEIPDK